MENKNEQFNVANLSDDEVKQVNTLEKSISKEKGEEVILVAYKNNQNNRK